MQPLLLAVVKLEARVAGKEELRERGGGGRRVDRKWHTHTNTLSIV